MVQWKQKVGDLDINLEQVGAGPHVILCLPGGLGFIEKDFGPILEHFDLTKFTVVVWDPPGYGKSRPPNRDFSGGAQMYTRDALCASHLMRSLGHRRYSLLGWDGGANTACIMASNHPDHVIKVVIWGGHSIFDQVDLRQYQTMDDLDNLSEEAKQPLVAAYGDEYLQEIWAGLNQSYRDISAAGGHICRNEAEQITCPTLILHGADDKTMPRAHAMWFKNHIANAE
ncbi:unnamed protein product [Orchesella dallaii]|uniref:AB hydrolase-1 domain-containing protein n=1 Tax=Orchesella dallaii TaxID=48710 RepID=A0ABP1QKD0_9HEXA